MKVYCRDFTGVRLQSCLGLMDQTVVIIS